MSTDILTHMVQVASSLPTTDAGWTTYAALMCESYSEGTANDVGSAVLHQYSGYGHEYGSTSVGQQDIVTNLGGLYVRILLLDGGPLYPLTGGWSQLWVGQIQRHGTSPDLATTNPGAPVTWDCSGLASVLDQVAINRGYQESYGIGSPVDPGYCPPFNAIFANGETGDRSSVTWTVNGQTVYIHDLGSTSSTWTARQIVEFVLAGFATPNLPVVGAVGPSWVLGGDPTALDYTPDKVDLHGKTVFEALNLLINPRRGITWRAVPATTAPYDTVTIFIDSCSPVALTAGAFTLPAAADQNALDLRGNAYAQDLQIEEDFSSVYDGIQVEGNRPLVAHTGNLHCTTALVASPFAAGDYSAGAYDRGWLTSYENLGGGIGWDPTIDQGPAYAVIYRRFILAANFNGFVYNLSSSDGLRNNRLHTDGSSSAPDKAKFGIGGYTGDRTYLLSGTPAPAPLAIGLHFECFVPLDTNAGSDISKGLCSPMVFIKEGSVYQDLTSFLDISIENNPPAVVLNGSPEAIQDLADRVNVAGVDLLFTVGIRESAPLSVSYLADAATWARDLPRLMVRTLPWAEQWIALKGTAYSVDATGATLNTLGANLTLIDDLPKLKDYLAFLRVWYTRPSVSVSWCIKGFIEYSVSPGSGRPGSLVSTVHRGDAAIDCNAVIVSRKVVLSGDGYGTYYTTRKIVPDLDAVESGMQKIQRHRGNVLANSNYSLREYDDDREFSGKPMAKPVFMDVDR